MSTEQVAPTGPMSDEARRRGLAQAVARAVAEGARVESQTDTQAVLVKGRRPNHLLHFIIGLVTFSLWWWLVWLPLSVFGGEKRTVLLVDEFGNVQAQGKARRAAMAYKPRDANQHWLLAWAERHVVLAALLVIFAGSIVVGFIQGVAQGATERTAVSKVVPTQDSRWLLKVTVTKPTKLVLEIGARSGQQVQVMWSTRCRWNKSVDPVEVDRRFETTKSARRRLDVQYALPKGDSRAKGDCVVQVLTQMHGTRPVSIRVKGLYATARGKSVKRQDNVPYPAPPLF